MRTVLRSENLEEIIKVVELEDGLSGIAGIQEFDAKGFYKGIAGHTRGILITDIGIFDSSMQLPQDLRVHIESDSPYLEMHFELAGGSHYSCQSECSMDISYGNGCHTLYYLPELRGYIHTLKNEHRKYFEIQLSVAFLKKIFNDDLGFLKQFGEQVEKNRPAMLSGKAMPITAAMQHNILDITNCSYTGVLKKVYLEAKVIELLSLQIAQFNEQYALRKSSLAKSDIEKLHYAKELVSNNITEPYSLTQLARVTGLNSFKLKEGFKELFENTVFGYLYNVRMEKAKDLLHTNEYTIAEIAFLVGYKNPHHFSTAFKKKYGVVPSKLKKN